MTKCEEKLRRLRERCESEKHKRWLLKKPIKLIQVLVGHFHRLYAIKAYTKAKEKLQFARDVAGHRLTQEQRDALPSRIAYALQHGSPAPKPLPPIMDCDGTVRWERDYNLALTTSLRLKILQFKSKGFQ